SVSTTAPGATVSAAWVRTASTPTPRSVGTGRSPAEGSAGHCSLPSAQAFGARTGGWRTGSFPDEELDLADRHRRAPEGRDVDGRDADGDDADLLDVDVEALEGGFVLQVDRLGVDAVEGEDDGVGPGLAEEVLGL